jgi:hypothetical protein
MLQLPPEPAQGQPVSARHFTMLIRYCRAITMRSSADLLVKTVAGGSSGKPIFPPSRRVLPSAVTPTPYSGQDASDSSGPQVIVIPGAHNSFVPSIDGTPIGPIAAGTNPPKLAIDSGAKIVYAQFDFAFGVNNALTIIDGTINSSDSATPPANTVTTSGSGGTGTLYQTLFLVSVATGTSGVPSVAIAQIVGGSQGFGICGGGISGPWGV